MRSALHTGKTVDRQAQEGVEDDRHAEKEHAGQRKGNTAGIIDLGDLGGQRS